MSLYLIIFGYQMSPFKTRAFTPYRSENSGLEDGDEACLEPRQKTCPEPCRRSSSLKLNKSPTSLGRGSTGFTLVEILITITIVGILSTVTVVIINPTQLYKQSRDSRRISDLNTLNLAAGAAQSEFGTSVLGNKNTIYVSVPDTISTCDNLELPQLPSGYSYHCADAPSLYKTDGSGWLPINLEGTNSSVSHLPVDPVNSVSSGLYYTYSTNNSYELTARPESVLYFIGGVVTITRDYDEVVSSLPIDRILLETDAPYVSPVAYRGKRNEPIYVKEVAKRLSEIRGISLADIQRTTTENAFKVFSIT